MATKITIETPASTPEGVETQASSVDHMVEQDSYEFNPADIGMDIAEGELSEANLTGIDDETTEETETETQDTAESEETSETETEETKEETKSSTEEKEEEKPADSESSEDTKTPPKGFVPLGALHEAREANKDLRASNRVLMARLESIEKQLSNPKKEEPEETFKVLSKAEYNELAEDNPSEAMKYLMDLKEFEDRQKERKETETLQKTTREQIEDVVAEVTSLMEAELPGISDENSDLYKGLIEFAPEIGFEQDMFYLTNPATQVILPGETEPLLLGDQALSMLKLLNNSRTKLAEAESKVPDEAELRKTIEAELRPVIQKELLEKIKEGGTEEFRSTTNIPRTEDEEMTSLRGKTLTENQMAKLSDKELEAYLAGE